MALPSQRLPETEAGPGGHSLGRKWVTFMVGDTRLPFLVFPFLLSATNMPGYL